MTLGHIAGGSEIFHDMGKSHESLVKAVKGVDRPHKADAKDLEYVKHMAMVNNPCSWTRRYLRGHVGMDLKYLQSYLNWHAYLFRARQAEERWPKVERVLRHLFMADATFRSSRKRDHAYVGWLSEKAIMRPAHMATKQKQSSDKDAMSDSPEGPFSGDAAAWTQALIMAIPGIAYLCEYYMRLSTYNHFGISQELISIRLEDILFIAVFGALLYWPQISDFLVLVLDNSKKGRRPFFLVNSVLWLVVISQAAALVSISIKCSIFDAWQYVLLMFQIAFISLFSLAVGRRWKFKAGTREGIRAALATYAIVSIVFSIAQSSYLGFHTSAYQICDEDNSLIVAYDGEGRAIEKTILRVTNQGVCELAEGYNLRDVTGKQIHIERFNYISVRV